MKINKRTIGIIVCFLIPLNLIFLGKFYEKLNFNDLQYVGIAVLCAFMLFSGIALISMED